MIGTMRGTVKLVPFSHGWKRSFNAERNKLKKVLGHNAIKIEHVGSTAIPGMVAKPIIDIAVIVPSFQLFKKYIPALAKIGYKHKADDDRVDRFFFPKGSIQKRTHYLHVGEVNTHYVGDMILFRDYLLVHDNERQRYIALKQELARKHSNERRIYTDKKKDFVNKVVRKARKLLLISKKVKVI
ncbi:MAG: GrpB family protein [bacterium]|nr:GrpB family protein [bacterium]